MLNKSFYQFGQIVISSSVVTTWLIIFILCLFSIVCTKYLTSNKIKSIPVVLEDIINIFHNAIADVLPQHVHLVFPFITTLWIFILCSNLIGVIPGLSSPTDDLSVTAALAIITFFAVHFFGIRSNGLRAYLNHYLKPNFLMLPFHLISEISRTIALAVRLFGNIISLELTALLILMVAGFLVPIPILILHIVEAIIQAYIFGMLALIYIASGIQSHEITAKNNQK